MEAGGRRHHIHVAKLRKNRKSKPIECARAVLNNVRTISSCRGGTRWYCSARAPCYKNDERTNGCGARAVLRTNDSPHPPTPPRCLRTSLAASSGLL